MLRMSSRSQKVRVEILRRRAGVDNQEVEKRVGRVLARRSELEGWPQLPINLGHLELVMQVGTRA
jgi:hypothetical protein